MKQRLSYLLRSLLGLALFIGALAFFAAPQGAVQAWYCNATNGYYGEVTQQGLVRYRNLSGATEAAQNVVVYINNVSQGTFPVPQLPAGTDWVTVGNVTVPPTGAFTWRLDASADCDSNGSYTAFPSTPPTMSHTATCGGATLTFNNSTRFAFAWDYRVGDQAPTYESHPSFPGTISQGPYAGQPFGPIYSIVNVPVFSTVNVPLTFPEDYNGGSVTIMYKLQLGAEQNWYLLPVTFTVDTNCIPDVYAPQVSVNVGECMYDAGASKVPAVLTFDNTASNQPVTFTVSGYANATRNVAAGATDTLDLGLVPNGASVTVTAPGLSPDFTWTASASCVPDGYAPQVRVNVGECVYDAGESKSPALLIFNNTASNQPVTFTVTGFVNATRNVAAGVTDSLDLGLVPNGQSVTVTATGLSPDFTWTAAANCPPDVFGPAVSVSVGECVWNGSESAVPAVLTFDNTGSNQPVTFTVTGFVNATRNVAAGATDTMDLGAVPNGQGVTVTAPGLSPDFTWTASASCEPFEPTSTPTDPVPTATVTLPPPPPPLPGPQFVCLAYLPNPLPEPLYVQRWDGQEWGEWDAWVPQQEQKTSGWEVSIHKNANADYYYGPFRVVGGNGAVFVVLDYVQPGVCSVRADDPAPTPQPAPESGSPERPGEASSFPSGIVIVGGALIVGAVAITRRRAVKTA
ncbi:hypothetical protein ANRL4_04333 [Anaerolineae bacterium]|nr:hypothetical protein ANRL4_04333 [Anaerolineae bacterium]